MGLSSVASITGTVIGLVLSTILLVLYTNPAVPFQYFHLSTTVPNGIGTFAEDIAIEKSICQADLIGSGTLGSFSFRQHCAAPSYTLECPSIKAEMIGGSVNNTRLSILLSNNGQCLPKATFSPDGDLTITNNFFAKDATITLDLAVGQNLNVAGNGGVALDFGVGQSIFVTGNGNIGIDLGIGQNLYVVGNANIGIDMTAGQNVYGYNGIYINNVNVGANLNVAGSAIIGNNVAVTGTVTALNGVYTNSLTSNYFSTTTFAVIGTTLTVNAQAAIGAFLTVALRNILANLDITAGQDISGYNGIYINNVNVGADMFVSGSETIGNNLAVVNTITALNGVYSNALSSVYFSTTTFAVIGTDLTVLGNILANLDITAGQDISGYNGFYINNVNVGADMFVSGSETIGNNLAVVNTITALNGVYSNALSSNYFSTTTFAVIGTDLTVLGNILANLDITAGQDISGYNGFYINNVNVGADLFVSGSETIGNNLAVVNTITALNGVYSNALSSNYFSTTTFAVIGTTLTVNAQAAIGAFLTVASSLTIGTYATIGASLTTGTTLSVGTDLSVGGTSNFVGNAAFQADVTVFGTFSNPSSKKIKERIQELEKEEARRVVMGIKAVSYFHTPDYLKFKNETQALPIPGWIVENVHEIVGSKYEKVTTPINLDLRKDKNIQKTDKNVLDIRGLSETKVMPFLWTQVQTLTTEIDELKLLIHTQQEMINILLKK
jgi:Asp/Glu/hydantoin racemase